MFSYATKFTPSTGEKIEYIFENNKEQQLYDEVWKDGLNVGYSSLFHPIKLTILLIIIGISYGIVRFFSNDIQLINNIYKYILMLWLIYLFYDRYRISNLSHEYDKKKIILNNTVFHTISKK